MSPLTHPVGNLLLLLQDDELVSRNTAVEEREKMLEEMAAK